MLQKSNYKRNYTKIPQKNLMKHYRSKLQKEYKKITATNYIIQQQITKKYITKDYKTYYIQKTAKHKKN